jgi:hypothetical protein
MPARRWWHLPGRRPVTFYEPDAEGTYVDDLGSEGELVD